MIRCNDITVADSETLGRQGEKPKLMHCYWKRPFFWSSNLSKSIFLESYFREKYKQIN